MLAHQMLPADFDRSLPEHVLVTDLVVKQSFEQSMVTKFSPRLLKEEITDQGEDDRTISDADANHLIVSRCFLLVPIYTNPQ